jgi:hypothetical protein
MERCGHRDDFLCDGFRAFRAFADTTGEKLSIPAIVALASAFGQLRDVHQMNDFFRVELGVGADVHRPAERMDPSKTWIPDCHHLAVRRVNGKRPERSPAEHHFDSISDGFHKP